MATLLDARARANFHADHFCLTSETAREAPRLYTAMQNFALRGRSTRCHRGHVHLYMCTRPRPAQAHPDQSHMARPDSQQSHCFWLSCAAKDGADVDESAGREPPAPVEPCTPWHNALSDMYANALANYVQWRDVHFDSHVHELVLDLLRVHVHAHVHAHQHAHVPHKPKH